MIWLLRLFQRALSKLLDDGDNLFDRDDNVYLCIMGEDDKGDGEDHTCEESRSYLERGSQLNFICVDYTSIGNQLFTSSDIVILAGFRSKSDQSHLL